ncbi:ATP-binding protein [Candidatus Poriferisodalis sp.]|uniref:ATP-binding protein n=1 Tax=Candidatus Poriferisodalis sp. TaxID=3101277 RepID=UPI003B029A0F
MASENPFRPSFGSSPPVLAGRGAVLDALAEALDDGPSHPDFTSLLVGTRGTGKTSTLNAIQQQADERGWPVIAENAHGDLCDRLTEATLSAIRAEQSASTRPRISGFGALGISVQLGHERGEAESHGKPRWRKVVTELASHLKAHGRGVLVTLDELQGGHLAELREMASTLQHVTRREELPVALVAAGLPSVDDVVLQDLAITFLQRCSRHEISELPAAAAATALSQPIRARGGRIAEEALHSAVAHSGGYPFMLQLIGYHAWRAASTNPVRVTVADMEYGIAQAQRRLPQLVLEPLWRALSDVDRQFALAMTLDHAESSVADLATRLGRSTSYLSTYRTRLIRAGFIQPAGRGRVRFTHPSTRDWLNSLDGPD